MLYYEVAVLGASLKPLTYSSNFKIPSYQIVSVPVKSSVKSAVILHEVAKPSFKTKEIFEISQLKISPFQIALANFIAHYYVCEKGVVFGIFEPTSTTAPGFENNASKQDRACEQTCAGEQNFTPGGIVLASKFPLVSQPPLASKLLPANKILFPSRIPSPHKILRSMGILMPHTIPPQFKILN